MEIKYACSECGGGEILVAMWVNPNTGDTYQKPDAEQKCFCQHCVKETKLETKQM